MTPLRKRLGEYLRTRQSLGFKLERVEMWLPKFVKFMERHKSRYITSDLALRWVRSESESPRSQSVRLTMVRGFAKHMHAIDPRTQIPSPDLILCPAQQRLLPYIYTKQDIVALMRATKEFPGLRQSTYETLIGLLAVTGMRVGEAIALDCSDIDWRNDIITIRNSKFGKSRQLPLHSSTMEALSRYRQRRDKAWPCPKSPAFFLSLNGSRLIYVNVHFTFLNLVRATGLWNARPHRPRIHDLRHNFIIKTLVRWYKAGLNVEAKMASLSTYVGHVSPSSTYWYLTATPELLSQAKTRLEHALGGLL